MTLYKEYAKERENKETVEDSSGRGFLTYRILDDCVYIVDVFVAKEFRKSGVAKEMADRVAEVAINLNKPLLGSVSPLDPNVTENMKVLLAYGMKFHKSTAELIYFVKMLGEK